jgi:hypothetical protein
MGLEYKLRSQLKLNYKLFVDMHMLREGAFTTIASGSQFYDGRSLSLLLPDTSADNTLLGVSDGQVWQSPYRQWVYESGVPIDGTNIVAPPMVASGVYIEGAFRHKTDATFGHTIDYINGRIIFDTPQSLDLQVHGEFSAREVRVGFEHDFNQQFTGNVLETQYSTNPLTSMQLVYPSGKLQTFPAIFIEVDGRTMEGYELGNRSAIVEDEVKFHIWALDDLTRDNIVDILTGQWRKSVPMVNFNQVPLPLSGIHNTLSPEYVAYQDMLHNTTLVTTVGSGTPIQFMSYINDVDTQNLPATEEYERALVTFRVGVYLNAPVTPLGQIFGPISTLPTIQDSGL